MGRSTWTRRPATRFRRRPGIEGGNTLIVRRGRFAWRRAGGVLLAAMAGTLLVMIARSPVPPRAWLAHPRVSFLLSLGENPFPVRLVRPPVAPLSAMAQLGRRLFFDPSLSSSGRLACASCHSPAHAYGPPGAQAAMAGGPMLSRQGQRAVPSLMYLERQPNFSVGPDSEETENVNLAQLAAQSLGAKRALKTARDTAQSAANAVPQGGLFWDGRADTLQNQALGPLLNPLEMDGGSIAAVAARLRRAPYARRFIRLFGPSVFASPRLAVGEALFAVARYQIEDPRFHPYSSKYDAWLEGKARLTQAELRGYLLFNDPKKADCAGCHLDRPSPDGLPPLFTDHQFEALGVPRNMALSANQDPSYFDLGICGPIRTDMADQTQYCGMFLTPTLRNVATRRVFFHNGVYHSLRQVLDFYNLRDTDPGAIYPQGPDGKVEKFNDIPLRYRGNVDRVDPPLDRTLGEKPANTQQDLRDIIAFLKTLTDGYEAGSGGTP
ncbi:MAG TPA: cytochrome c peroxidase [Acetobacteraceae bacterium]|nr:cytochrome c peroxidase [Acetobacteraceae bacterium]